MMRLVGWVALGLGMAAGQTRVHVLNGPVVLGHRPAVARGVDAMPVVMAGPGATLEVAAKVNTALRRLDAKVKEAAAGCRDERARGEWQRRLEVTMRGPRYLSLTVDDNFYCGGAHPDGGLLPLVYDLKTGGTVNWLKLLPPGAASGVDDAADGSKVGAVIWPVLSSKARNGAAPECREAFDSGSLGQITFVLWLDARAGAVMAQPSDFPHALAGCAVPVAISVGEARQMGGFNAEMLDALEAAHGMQR